MGLSVFKADETYKRYFNKEVLTNGVGYVVSSDSAVCGFFSFIFLNDHQATMNFPYCLDKKAIELAFLTFLNDYPQITELKSLSMQKLDFLGFDQKIYKRKGS